MQKKTMAYVGVGVVVVAVAAGAAVAIMKNKKDEQPTMMLFSTKARKAVDYDATASMWEDEERVFQAASKLDKH